MKNGRHCGKSLLKNVYAGAIEKPSCENVGQHRDVCCPVQDSNFSHASTIILILRQQTTKMFRIESSRDTYNNNNRSFFIESCTGQHTSRCCLTFS
jgi:hypothetical protein